MNWTDFQNLTEEEKEKLWNDVFSIDSSGLFDLVYQKIHPEHKLPFGKFNKKSIVQKVSNMTPREKFDYLTSNE